MKKAKQSFSKEDYPCKQSWPDDCFVQCGGNGIVFQEGSLEEAFENPVETLNEIVGTSNKKKSYRTAFFEAFPKNPSCFLRGEGSTIEEAELAAWNKWQKISNCKGHEFERHNNRKDGYANCLHCGLKGMFLQPSTNCLVCQVPAFGYTTKDKNYCIKHYYELPIEDAVVEEEVSSWSSLEQEQFYFIETKEMLQQLPTPLDNEELGKIIDQFVRFQGFVKAHLNPLFSEEKHSKKDIHFATLMAIPKFIKEIKK